ncbi:sulfurtransferase [Arcobacter sp. FW59]|nr:sulfurtransferase [Arcobacter sp. FW59]
MIKKIDIESNEFKNELKNTIKFTQDVLKTHNLVFNPNNEVNEAIQMGLTRNMIIYGKRYCPCFMVIEESETEKNRLCPCVPALSVEIPNNGSCHCGIFVTPQKAQNLQSQANIEEDISDFNGLSKKECEDLFYQEEINSQELEALLEARDKKAIDFYLVDTREWMEWINARIKGVDFLVPTTSFYHSIESLNDKKNIPIVVYCHSGSRSAYCQRVMQNMGFEKVVNLDFGISSFRGDLIRGE